MQNEKDDMKWDRVHHFQSTSNYNKIKVGGQEIRDDAFLTDVFWRDQFSTKRIDTDRINRAIEQRDLAFLRDLSKYYYESNGIYNRLCQYFARFFRYDWYITPMRFDKKLDNEKIVEGWYKACRYLENSDLKHVCSDIALTVLVEGQYCGYRIEQKDKVFLQELPPSYCRSRYKHNNNPTIEFNVRFFDDMFQDNDQRLRVLKMFPKEFQQAYVKYKKGTLPQDTQNDERGWVLLDPEKTVKFNLGGSDIPLFISIIPNLMDLKDMQDMDKRRMMQQLLKLLVQHFDFGKNRGEHLDLKEIEILHNNAVRTLSPVYGVDVLSTFANVDILDLADDNRATNSSDDLRKTERGVYNAAGVSQMMFNTEGNLALDKTIANNESLMSDLLLQLEDYAQSLLKIFNKNTKRLEYRFQFLHTTPYNYKEMAQAYKEQTMLGFSRLLPAVALGQSQSSVIATAVFENEMLGVNDLFIPPQMSSTMSGKEETNIKKDEEKSSGNAPKSNVPVDDKGGRPPLPDDQKSDKTMRNIESGQ